jgi:hypothetical protein
MIIRSLNMIYTMCSEYYDFVNSFNWNLAKQITLIRTKDLDNLLDDGYEIVMMHYTFKAETPEDGLHGHAFIGLYCETCEEKFIHALSTPIFEYISHFFELYNKDKKKPVYTWVSDPSIFWKFEESLRPLLYGDLTLATLNLYRDETIYTILKSFLETEKNLYSCMGRFSDIFSTVCIIHEADGFVKLETISKTQIQIEQINIIIEDARNFNMSIALSFFVLSKKYEYFTDSDDLVVGIIIYDLKNRKTLAFNMESVISYGSNFSLSSQNGLFEMADYLFGITIKNKITLITKLSLPLNSLYYTPISWLQYVILKNDPNDNFYEFDEASSKIRVPEIFVFGYNDLRTEPSFDHNSFSNNRGGHSTFLFNLNNDVSKIKYNLRFDQSAGEELLHIDYGFYKERHQEFKLISHKIIDFEEVYNLNEKLYMAMIFAGLFDAHFNTILSQIQGVENLNKRNNALLYSLHWVYIIEKMLNWIN